MPCLCEVGLNQVAYCARVYGAAPFKSTVRARRCRHPSFAPTFSFLATARGRRRFRGLLPIDPAGPPNTSAGNALRPSPAFLLLPPHEASPQFESCRRAILEPLKLSGPLARLPHDPERRRVITDSAPSRARRCRVAIPVSRLLSPSSPPHAADAPFEGCRRAIPQVRRTQALVMRCARRPPSLTTPRRSIVRVVALAGPCRKFSALALVLVHDTHISACLHLLTISCDRFRVIVPTTFLSARASPILKKSWVRIL
jgi:hypothetical protein